MFAALDGSVERGESHNVSRSSHEDLHLVTDLF